MHLLWTLLAFPFMLVLGTGMTSLISGWYRLSKSYPLRIEQAGERLEEFPLSSLHFGVIARYSSAIHIDVHTKGLVLRPVLYFRFLHPPMFLPWKELSKFYYAETYFSAYLEFTFGGKWVRVRGDAASFIARFVKTKRHDDLNPFST